MERGAMEGRMTSLTLKQRTALLKPPARNAPHAAANALRGLVFGLLAWLADAQSRSAARYHLQELDDRQLRDVGLTRVALDRALGSTFLMIC